LIAALVDVVRAALFAAGHLLGGSIGGAIIALSLLVRLALLPLTIRLARRAIAQQVILASLRPQLERLRIRYRDEPDRLAEHTIALYRQAGYRPFTPTGILGAAVQLPLVAALYGAVRSGIATGARFCWIPDLARPDGLLALAVAGITALGAYLGTKYGATPGRPSAVPLLIGTAVTLFVLWRASAALLLSWGATACGNLLQTALLGRRRGLRGSC